MKNQKLITRCLIISLSVLITVGSALTLYFLANPDTKRDDVIKAELDRYDSLGVSTAKVNFEATGINPADTVKHTVELTGEVEGEADLTLSFNEDKNHDNKLAQYLYVTVNINGTEYCNMKLSELFGKTLDTLECVIDEKEPVIIEVSYHMPSETGNEAAYTEAFFDLLITATNE